MVKTTKSNTILAIFDTFKSKSDLTGEANRQRSIISILAGSGNPTEKTRTGISQQIAAKQGIIWKNIYSGIFRDLDEVLIPAGIVEEKGRLPLKRGPKALQEQGIPYYHLTRSGILVALATNGVEGMEKIAGKFFAESEPEEKKFEKAIASMQKLSPDFTYSILQKYVKAFCDGLMEDLLPFDPAKLKHTNDQTINMQKEILDVFLTLPKQDIAQVLGFLDRIAQNAKH